MSVLEQYFPEQIAKHERYVVTVRYPLDRLVGYLMKGFPREGLPHSDWLISMAADEGFEDAEIFENLEAAERARQYLEVRNDNFFYRVEKAGVRK